jgi:hypothetical protein
MRLLSSRVGRFVARFPRLVIVCLSVLALSGTRQLVLAAATYEPGARFVDPGLETVASPESLMVSNGGRLHTISSETRVTTPSSWDCEFSCAYIAPYKQPYQSTMWGFSRKHWKMLRYYSTCTYYGCWRMYVPKADGYIYEQNFCQYHCKNTGRIVPGQLP